MLLYVLVLSRRQFLIFKFNLPICIRLRFRSQRGAERELSGNGSEVDSGAGTLTRFKKQRALDYFSVVLGKVITCKIWLDHYQAIFYEVILLLLLSPSPLTWINYTMKVCSDKDRNNFPDVRVHELSGSGAGSDALKCIDFEPILCGIWVFWK